MVTLMVLNGFFFNFNVNVRTLPYVCKVKATYKITLLPGQRAYFLVKYKLLLTDYSFTFKAKYAVTINVVINAKLPKVVIVLNTTKETLTIAKNTVIGYIRKSTNSGYFITIQKDVLKIIAVSVTLVANINALMPFNSSQLTVTLLVVAKFKLNYFTRAVADGYISKTETYVITKYPNSL